MLSPNTLRQLETTLREQWERCCGELKRCRKTFSEEAVHDSRVATRRLVALFELLSPFVRGKCLKKARAALKEHLDAFDKLRDTQVQLETVHKMSRAFTAARHFRDHLLRREAQVSRKTRRNLKTAQPKRLGRLVADCQGQLKQWRRHGSLEAANARLLSRVDGAFSRTRQLRQLIRAERPRTIHRTRIAFKKFRYMVEALAPHLDGVNAKRLAAMHAYQTRMGDIQDIQVLLEALGRFARQADVPAGAAESLTRALKRRRERLIDTYLDWADELLEFWPTGNG
jgi:CHAD domain-containing protein